LYDLVNRISIPNSDKTKIVIYLIFGLLPVIGSRSTGPTVARHFRLSMFPRHVAVERALRRVALAAALAQVRLHKLVLREQVVPSQMQTNDLLYKKDSFEAPV
jgi:hypothetical protein